LASLKVLKNAKSQIEALNNEYADKTPNVSGGTAVAGSVVNEVDAAKVNEYTAAVAGLSAEQQRLLLSTAALTDKERDNVLANLESIRSTNEQKIAFVAKKYNLDKATVAQQLGIEADKKYAQAEIEARIAASDFGKSLSKQQQKQMAAELATRSHAASLKEWAGNMALAVKAAAKNFISSPIAIISAITTIASVGINAIRNAQEKAKQAAEENEQKVNDVASAANDQREQLNDLIAQYSKLASAGDFDSSSREQARSIQDQITELVGSQADNLDLVNGKLDDEIVKLKNVSAEQAKQNANALQTKVESATNKYKQGALTEDAGTKTIDNPYSTGADIELANSKALNEALKEARYSGEALLDVNNKIDVSWAAMGKDAAGMVDIYKEIQDTLLSTDEWRSTDESENSQLLNDIQSKIDLYQSIVDEYNSAVANQMKNDAVIEISDMLKETTVNSQETFDSFIASINNMEGASDQYKQYLAEVANQTFPQYAQAAQDATNATDSFSAAMSKVKNMMSESSSDAVDAANKAEADSIKEETAALEASNEELQKHIDNLQDANDKRSTHAISDYTAEIEKNNAAIAENNRLLNNMPSPWSGILSTFDTCSGVLEQIASIQNEVADGFTISADKAREFAEAYPEILANATVSADGQVTLNQGIVDAFISGKQEQVNAAIDAEIADLQAKKASLEGQMAFAQAELEIAQNVGDGEGQISKEVAEYRINTGNIMAQALIDNGVQEADAWRLAAAAMSQNTEEFDRVAMEVCTDVNGNFNAAAYNAAQSIYQNMASGKSSVASFAKQCHEAAKAFAGIGSGEEKGTDAVVGGATGAVSGKSINLNLTKGSFDGTNYTYKATQTSLDDFTSDLQLDVSKYQQQIAQINSQIALLESLKNKPLGSYGNSSGSGGSKGGSGGGSSSSTKEVEEYIASIDEYREALERLARTQAKVDEIQQKINLSDNLEEQLLMQQVLIGAYEREQDALVNLNNQRKKTLASGAEELRNMGFAVEYNAEKNEFFVENMEHVNDLVADSAGEFDTLQEATNDLRKSTEEHIKTLEDLNKSNQDSANDFADLKTKIKDAREEIQNLLETMVKNKSEAVDSIQEVYETLHNAADEYAKSGYIAIDTLQSIIDLGMEYVAYLMDENGNLVINEERIRKVIAARTQQMAVETALTYVESLRIAKQNDDVETMNRLLNATEETTNATWGLVYANLSMLDLTEEQRKAALANINALRALADSAVDSIGKSSDAMSDSLNNMKDGLDSILDYVISMLTQQINDQIDSLNDMKDAYSEIIDLKKESLEASKNENDYQKELADKMKEMAKLQARIDILSLDDSRSAQAERAKLMEEMQELQGEMSEKQADHAREAQEDALDKMNEAYGKEKDKEIEALEESISSYQKKYDMAIKYIQEHWDTLFDELINWNTEYGNDLNETVVKAWENALEAVKKYGSYVDALDKVDDDIGKNDSSGDNSNTTIGKTEYDEQYTNGEKVHAIVKQMNANSEAWETADDETRKELAAENERLGHELSKYGVDVYRNNNGEWIVAGTGRKLFDVYDKYKYNNGIGEADIKNEPNKKPHNKAWIDAAIEFTKRKVAMSRSNDTSYSSGTGTSRMYSNDASSVARYVSTDNSQTVNIVFGDTNITNADQKTVTQHAKVTEDQVNQIAKILGVRR
jgi:hypothetical protein